ncbi:MAG: hypothetical protein ACXU93_06130 [Thermodesulfobacteriota bacterium]
MKRTVFCAGLFPKKFLPLASLRSSSVVEALHLLALATKDRSIQTRVQVIFIRPAPKMSRFLGEKGSKADS